MKSIYAIILLGFLLIKNILAVKSEKNDQMIESTIHHESHRPDHRAAMNAIMRAQFHVDSAKFAEDRMWRTDNQLHHKLNMANLNAHKENFIKEQQAYNLAMYGNKDGQGMPSVKHHTQPIESQTQSQAQAQKSETKNRIEKKRSALKIESGNESPVPAKQLRIGTKADDIRSRTHSRMHNKKDRSETRKETLPVNHSPRMRTSSAKSSLPESSTPKVITQTPKSSKSRSKRRKSD